MNAQLGHPAANANKNWSKEYMDRCTTSLAGQVVGPAGPPGVINALSELIEVSQVTHKYLNELEERLNPLLRAAATNDIASNEIAPPHSSETKALVSRGTYELRRINNRIQELTARIDL